MPLSLALALFLSAPAQAPESEAAKKARADLAAVNASLDKLSALRERIQKIQEQLRAGSEDLDRPKKLAQQLEEKGREFEELRVPTVKAVEALLASAGEGLKAAPEDPGLLDVRSSALLLFNREEEALGDLEVLANLRPDDAEVALKTGRLEQKFNRYESAVANLEKAVRKDPSGAEPRILLAMSYFAVHRFDESAAAFDEVLKEKLDPSQERTVREYRRMAGSYVETWKKEEEIRRKDEKAGDLPRVVLATTKGEVELELFENEAPNTVANFIELVTKKFYDGLKFHRVLPGFMAQGGCPKGDGSGDPGYRFKDEIPESYRRHFRGSLSMANAGPDSNGSQFFITHLPTEWLNGKHTVFGRVVRGQDVVDRLRAGDEIKEAKVTRKRDHAYAVRKLGDEKPDEEKKEK